jgi:error-prone DNA polymerase
VATLTGLPVVATGAVLMHARSRKPLQDVLTATRLKHAGGRGGFALEPNAEAHLRSRARLAALYRPEWLAATLRWPGAAPSRSTSCATNTREEIVPAGHTPTSWLRR